MSLVLVVQDVSINIVMDSLINQPKKTIQVAVGIVSNKEGKLLIAKRLDHWLGAGFWEFPGGKIEPKESNEMALKRELMEEVGVDVQKCHPLIRLSYEYPERKVVLHAWNVTSFTGIASGLEGQEIRWCYPHELNNINMLPANRAIVIAAQLPDIYTLSPPFENAATFLPLLEKTLQRKPVKLLLLQADNLTAQSYTQLAKQVFAFCRHAGVRLMLTHPELAVVESLEADGIHLSLEQLHQINERPKNDIWVAATCNTAVAIQKAEQLGLDFLMINSINLDLLEELIANANLPVYTLSRSLRDNAIAKGHGAQGVAMIL